MIVRERDGSHVEAARDMVLVTGRTQAVVELRAEEVLQHSAVIDRVLCFAFDVLGLSNVELRISEGSKDTPA